MAAGWLPTVVELSGTSVILVVGYAFRRTMGTLDRAMSERWTSIDTKLADLKDRLMADGKTLREQVRDMQRDKREHDTWARQQSEMIERRLSRVEGRLDLEDIARGAER